MSALKSRLGEIMKETLIRFLSERERLMLPEKADENEWRIWLSERGITTSQTAETSRIMWDVPAGYRNMVLHIPEDLAEKILVLGGLP